MDPQNFRHATEKCVGSSSVILCTSKMFELFENILFPYADDSTLLAVVCKPVDRPVVPTFLNRNLPRIEELCNHWCMILNYNKIIAAVVRRSRTESSPHGGLIMVALSWWLCFLSNRVSCRCVIDVVWQGLVCSTRLI